MILFGIHRCYYHLIKNSRLKQMKKDDEKNTRQERKKKFERKKRREKNNFKFNAITTEY